MRAIITDNQWIYFDNITDYEDNILWVEFSVSDPNRYVDPNQFGMWDGIFRKYNRSKQRMARPLLSYLRGVCTKHNLPLDIINQRSPAQYQALDPQLVDQHFLPGITLDDHQIQAIRKSCKVECGIIQAPTGSGKTEIICGICKAIPCPTVVVAEEKVILDQLKARLELRAIDDEIGLFYGGVRPNGETIIVGSIHSLQNPSKIPTVPNRATGEPDEDYKKRLAKWESAYKGYKTRRKNAKYLQEYVKRADMVIVDECVHEDSWIPTTAGLMMAGELERMINAGNRPDILVYGTAHPISAVNRSKKRALKLHTISNRQLIVSENHKCALLRDGILTDDYAINLLPGDMLLTAHMESRVTEIDIAWWHLGLFIGDGHWMQKHPHRVRFAVRKDLDDWRAAISSIIRVWDGHITEGTNQRGDLLLSVDSERFCGFLEYLGFKPGRKCGLMHPKFVVPNHRAAAGLLRGLFDSEGTTYRSHAKFAMTDELVVRFAQVLMSYLGIASTVGFGRRKLRKHAPLWRLSVCGENYRKFLQSVGLGFSRKQITHVGNLESNRFINPQWYYSKWLASGLPVSRLAKCLKIHTSELSPRTRNNISLSRLLQYEHAILELATSLPKSYTEAREYFGVSDAKVAAMVGLAVMTVWNRRKNGDDSLWHAWVRQICTHLQNIPTLPANIASHYTIEPLRLVEPLVGEFNMLDFSVQSASRFEANGLLVHNCDKATSDLYRPLFQNWFTGRRRFGLSATPFDLGKPVEAMVLQERLGSIIARTSRHELITIGRIVDCDYKMFVVGPYHNISDKTAFDIAKDEWMVNNNYFHKLIATICTKYKGDGTLVLVDRELLGLNLVEAIRATGLSAEFIYGKTPKRRRDQLLRAFERRDLDVLIGGKIIHRGLDLRGGCENLILATGGKLASNVLQQVGRALRLNSRNHGRIFDFFFRCNHYLYDHSKNRLRIMVADGYPTEVIFPGGTIDGAELIKNRFRVARKMFERAAPTLF